MKFPVRIKCATLSWNTLAQGLDEVAASPRGHHAEHPLAAAPAAQQGVQGVGLNGDGRRGQRRGRAGGAGASAAPGRPAPVAVVTAGRPAQGLAVLVQRRGGGRRSGAAPRNWVIICWAAGWTIVSTSPQAAVGVRPPPSAGCGRAVAGPEGVVLLAPGRAAGCAKLVVEVTLVDGADERTFTVSGLYLDLALLIRASTMRSWRSMRPMSLVGSTATTRPASTRSAGPRAPAAPGPRQVLAARWW